MPTYDYRCTDCQNEFEHFQSIKAAPLSTCPQCQGRLERLIGGGGALIFKGSGFYITDYRSDEYKAAAKKETDSRKDSAKPESPASDKDKKAKPQASES